MKKENIFMSLPIILILLVLVTTSVVGGILAKYIS